MEERVGSSADHDPLGQPRDEAAAHHGPDQRQRRRDAGEVRLCGPRGGGGSGAEDATLTPPKFSPLQSLLIMQTFKGTKSKHAAE